MTQLSRNFNRSEFACKCGCGCDDVDPALVDTLQGLRDFFDRAVTITSGCRCESHNKAVGGSPNSQHLLGKAADVVVYNVSPELVAEWAMDNDVPGIGATYATFTHLDVRSGPKARW